MKITMDFSDVLLFLDLIKNQKKSPSIEELKMMLYYLKDYDEDKKGQPFLEVHHIHYLSNGGNDTIDNVIALCPNCHRKIPQLELEEYKIKHF